MRGLQKYEYAQCRSDMTALQMVLLLLCSLGAAAEFSPEDWTCKGVKLRPTDSLQHCKFIRSEGYPINDTTPILCDALGRWRNSLSILNYTIYFHGRYVFQISPNFTYEYVGDNRIVACIGYIKLIYQKLTLDKVWTNVTYGIYTNDGFSMLAAFKNIRSEMRTNAEVPVGFLELDRNCWEQESRNESCILSIHILKEVKSLNISVSPLDPEAYTKMLRDMFVTTLHGTGYEFWADINPEISALTQKYAIFIIEGFGYKHMHIGGGKWEKVEKVIPFSRQLLTVELPNNRIESIAEGNFGHVLNLENLVLCNNNLSSLPQDMILLKNLKKLDLSNNPFLLHNELQVNRTSNILYELQSLKSLSLSGVKMKNLAVLRLILQDSTIQLEHLNLSLCGIESLQSLREQLNLKSLDLSGNNLFNFHYADFSNSVNLSYLLLANSNITGPLMLNVSDSLKLLDLSQNRIHDPSQVVICGYVNVLDLSKNMISNWSSPNIFESNPVCKLEVISPNCEEHTSLNCIRERMSFVSHVNFSFNSITSMSSLMCKSISVLASVDLGGNVFNCDDCQTPGFQNWLISYNNTLVLNVGSQKNITCSVPSLGVSIVDYIVDLEACLPVVVDYGLLVGIPVASILVIGLLTTGTAYRFRFEVTYLLKRGIWRQNIEENCGTYIYDAFVSYSRSDRWWVVEKLCANMEQCTQQYRLCLHERDFALGSLIFDNIEESMKSSRFMIVVLSNNFLNSQWCRWELDMANRQLFDEVRDFLILVQLEKLDRDKIPKRLRLLMDTQTTIEWPKHNNIEQEFWSKLRQKLGSSLYSLEQNIDCVSINGVSANEHTRF